MKSSRPVLGHAIPGDAGGAARVDERDVDIVDRLRGVPALRVANEAAARRLAAACACVAFRAGDVIVRQGEPADAVHVLHAGEARVSRSPGRPAAVFGAPGAPPPPPPAAAAYVAYAREGAAIGLEEELAGVPHFALQAPPPSRQARTAGRPMTRTRSPCGFIRCSCDESMVVFCDRVSRRVL